MPPRGVLIEVTINDQLQTFMLYDDAPLIMNSDWLESAKSLKIALVSKEEYAEGPPKATSSDAG